MNCNEALFDVITSIEAYDFSGVSTTRTMNVHTKNVSESDLGLASLNKMDVPMKPKSCTYSEKSSVEIPGDSYEVTVSWEVRQADKSIYAVLGFKHKNFFMFKILNTHHYTSNVYKSHLISIGIILLKYTLICHFFQRLNIFT